MGLHLGIGIALSFSYILFQTISSTFAINGNAHPNLVWIPNILYLFIVIYHRKAPNKENLLTNHHDSWICEEILYYNDSIASLNEIIYLTLRIKRSLIR